MKKARPYYDPPQFVLQCLRWYCARSFMEEVEGDLYEFFQEEVEIYGLKKARLRFVFTALQYITPYFYGKRDRSADLFNPSDMYRHYFKLSFRRLIRERFYSTINILGLAIGMACFMTVLLFVRDENSYDRYHTEADQLYRLSIQGVIMSSGDEYLTAKTPILWGPALKRDFPEVESYARFVRLPVPESPWQFGVNEHLFLESDILHADPDALQLFNWPLIKGDANSALSQPRSIVLSETMAHKYFGDSDPMGRTIRVNSQPQDGNDAAIDHKVTGVLKDIPHRSHFTFDFLLPANDLNDIYGGDINSGSEISDWYWRGTVAYTYLKFAEGTQTGLFEAKFEDFQNRYLGDATRSRGYYYVPFVQNIEEIYLDGNMQEQLTPVGDKIYPYMFSIIAFFVLLLACINFMNLATARAAIRGKEVGLRKVVGAHRSQLVRQFISESVVISFMAFILALVLARLILPHFYNYLNKDWVMDYAQEVPLLLTLIFIGLGVGILSGSYPAFVLSRFQPVQVLRGFLPNSQGGILLRKGLVVFQFSISAFLIIGTLTVFKQLHFMRNHDLGFNQDHVIVLPPDVAEPLSDQYSAIKSALLAHPQITNVTMASGVPGQGGGGDLYAKRGAPSDSGFGLGELLVDYNFADFFGLELLAGRNFSIEQGSDAPQQAEDGRFRAVKTLINEEAMRRFGWSDPEEAIGQQIIRDPHAIDWTATVVGVVKDFHLESLQQSIVPCALVLVPNYNHMAIKLLPGDPQSALAVIEAEVKNFAPATNFRYGFLDETFRAQYLYEQKLSEVFGYISFLAIFIACLGLMGLAAFTTARRIKEIGIRKTLGASIPDIVRLLSKDFSKLVIIAVVVAIPFAYWATEQWLQEFAFHISSNVSTYVWASLLSIAIALITISFQTISAARLDPAKSLKAE